MQSKMVVVKKLQMDPIEEFLNIIEDGKWHNLSNITSRGSVEVAHFLEKYGFINIDEFNKKAIIDEKFKEL